MRVVLLILVVLAMARPAQAVEGLREVWRDSAQAGPVTLWTLKLHAYAPPTLKPPAAPAVVLLHGCLQGPGEFFENSGWHKVADDRGLLLVVAEFDDLGQHCLWWFEPEQRRPATARQADAIVKGLAQARQQFGVPEGENYVAGLSAGAAMSQVLLALLPDTFAAGASIAGVAFDCPALTDKTRLVWAGQPCTVPGMQELGQACACMAGDVEHAPAEWAAAVNALHPGRTAWPRISIWQGTADPVVLCRNAVETAEQWSSLHGGGPPVGSCPDSKLTEKLTAKRDPAKDQRWVLPGRDGRAAVELRLLDGFTHAVPVAPADGCGQSGKFFADAGVCSARALADFFLDGR